MSIVSQLQFFYSFLHLKYKVYFEKFDLHFFLDYLKFFDNEENMLITDGPSTVQVNIFFYF